MRVVSVSPLSLVSLLSLLSLLSPSRVSDITATRPNADIVVRNCSAVRPNGERGTACAAGSAQLWMYSGSYWMALSILEDDAIVCDSFDAFAAFGSVGRTIIISLGAPAILLCAAPYKLETGTRLIPRLNGLYSLENVRSRRLELAA